MIKLCSTFFLRLGDDAFGLRIAADVGADSPIDHPMRLSHSGVNPDFAALAAECSPICAGSERRNLDRQIPGESRTDVLHLTLGFFEYFFGAETLAVSNATRRW